MAKLDIPDWYNKDIYSKELSLNQWIRELEFRFLMFKRLHNKEDELNEDGFISVVSKTGSDISIYPLKGNTEKEYPVFKSKVECDENFKYHFVPKKPLAIDEELASLETYISDPIETIAVDMTDVQVEEIEGKKLITNLVSSRSSSPVVISINIENYNNDVLREKFEVYLKEIRKEQQRINYSKESTEIVKLIWGGVDNIELTPKIGKQGDGSTTYTDKTFQKWSRFKLLGVIDFLIWGRIKGINYTHNALDKILYPDDAMGSVDKIRDVKGWIYELFFSDGISLLKGMEKLK